MFRTLTSVFLFLVMLNANAQVFKKYYTEWFDKMLEVNEELITFDHWDKNILRINSKGEISSRTKLDHDGWLSIIKTSPDGSVFFYDSRSFFKVGKNGDISLNVTTGLWYVSDIDVTDYDDILFAGSIGIRPSDSYLLKYDNLGKELINKHFLGINNMKVASLPSGSIIGGMVGSRGDSLNLMLLDASANILISKALLVKGNILDIFNDPGHVFIITREGTWLVLDLELEVITSFQFDAHVYQASLSSDALYLVCKETTSSGIVLRRLGLSGDLQWERSLDIYQNTYPVSVKALKDDGVVAVCSTFVDANRSIIYRFDKDGNLSPGNISGKIVLDEDNDCITDDMEKGIEHKLVKAEPGPYYAFKDSKGRFSMPVDTGITYTVAPILHDPYLFENRCALSQSIKVDTSGRVSEVSDFHLKKVDCPRLAISTNYFNSEACFRASHKLVVSNYGNMKAENTLVRFERPSVLHILQASLPYTDNNGLLTFSLGTIDAGSAMVIDLVDSTSCRFQQDEYYVRSTVTTSSYCQFPEASEASVVNKVNVLSSYDPNDKNVFPSLINIDDYHAGTNKVRFVIRFQNTGNGRAANVRIIDTLSSMIDVTSIKAVVASHQMRYDVLNIAGQAILEFFFPNIDLTYQEFSEAESQGFVSFEATLTAGLASGIEIRNSAAIYFDFNEPIITNDGIVHLDELKQTETYQELILTNNTHEEGANVFSFFPNPASVNSAINIALPYEACQLSIYDQQGHLKKQVVLEQKISIFKHGLDAGIYFYQITKDGGLLFSGKVIVK